MAETKRVSDQYKISAPSIVLYGNLTVTGSTTSVETINSTVKDNIIVLNDGEVGAGVTAGTAGIEIERGSLTNATFTFNETNDVWEAKIGGSFAVVRGTTPVGVNDLTTKDYVDTKVALIDPAGVLYSVQFNDAPNGFGGDANFLYDGVTVTIQDIEITTGSIQTTTTNGDLEIAANGSGTLYLRSVLKLEDEISDPSSTVGTNKVYSKTPGNAGSGLYFVNSTASDELVSKSKAILFGLIF
jgi:hypothetical protein